MSGAKGGKVSIKLGVPNLSFAGKREDKTENGQQTKKGGDKGKGNRGRGSGNHGRGRGRGAGGRGGRFERPGLIQSEGIFSDGLHCEPSRKHVREAVPDIAFAKDSRQRKADEKKEEANEDSKPSFGGWEEEWASDEEGDREALAEVIGNDQFISDLKGGSRIPIVLPDQDEDQFLDVITSKAKKEVINKREVKNLNMVEYRAMDFDADQIKQEEEECPTLHYSRKAADIFANAKSKVGQQALFILQLPSTVNVLTTATDDASERMQINGVEEAHGSTSTSKPAEEVTNDIPRLPKGSKIGKIQVTKRGLVRLAVNGISMEIASASAPGTHENVILLETQKNIPSEESFGPFGGNMMQTEGTNAVYHLGKVDHHLVASMDFSGIQPKSAERSKVENPASSRSLDKSTVLRLRRQLLELEEQTVSWGKLAESWADP